MLSETLPRKIYIVDDDDAVRDSLRALLESVGFEVRDFHSARDFLAERTLDSVGCLLLDLHMPVMSGIDLLEHMQESGPQLPTIVITGRSDAFLKERALRSGAREFIDKPVSDDTLIEAIDRVLGAV
jgi:two-component system response regulator FixJ